MPLTDPLLNDHSPVLFGRDLRERNHHRRSQVVRPLGSERAVEGDRRVYDGDIAARHQRIDLIQGRDSRVDLPIHKSGVSEDHEFDMPGNVKIAARGRNPHQVIVPFDRRTRVALR